MFLAHVVLVRPVGLVLPLLSFVVFCCLLHSRAGASRTAEGRESTPPPPMNSPSHTYHRTSLGDRRRGPEGAAAAVLPQPPPLRLGKKKCPASRARQSAPTAHERGRNSTQENNAKSNTKGTTERPQQRNDAQRNNRGQTGVSQSAVKFELARSRCMPVFVCLCLCLRLLCVCSVCFLCLRALSVCVLSVCVCAFSRALSLSLELS